MNKSITRHPNVGRRRQLLRPSRLAVRAASGAAAQRARSAQHYILAEQLGNFRGSS